MNKRNLHVVPIDDAWVVRKSGARRASGVYLTEDEALMRAQKLQENQKVTLFLHGRDGRIRERRPSS